MGNIELLAIVFGILIILKRLPLLVWPDKTLSKFKKWASSTGNVKAIGALMFVAGIAFVFLIWNEISFLQLFVGAISINMLAFGFAYFFMPGMAAEMLRHMEGKKSIARIAGLIGLLVGLLLVYLGYKGL